MLKKITFLSLCIFHFAFLSGSAQDIHFSQFTASPLNINPAMTGVFNGDYRVIANYRNQWGSVIVNSFDTRALSADFSLFKGKMGKDFVGAGLSIFSDKAGASQYGTLQISGSLSYNKALNSFANQYLSMGIQMGYAQRSINFSNLQFGSQYDGQQFDPNITSGEGFGSGYSFLDFSSGLLWYYFINSRLNVYSGVSLAHINRPNQSFFSNTSDRLYSRIAVQAGSEIKTNSNFSYLPAVLLLRQGPSQEIDLGTYVKYEVDAAKATAFYVGAWGRLASPFADALMFSTKIDYRGFSLGISYDVNVSSLNVATNKRGGPELALTYIGNFGKDDGTMTRPVICPRF
ncbi:MAG: PorP/SprF family type IX secretion system membrane protein [Bacteroidetes bacterium]|nr:PorP/SprF family type IX secretion system membrane protein [Bacteroidota bacterium]